MVDLVVFGIVNDGAECYDLDHQPLVQWPGEEGFNEDLFLLAELDANGSDSDDSNEAFLCSVV